MAVVTASWAPDTCQAAETPSATITVGVDKSGAVISPILNGVFFEDINFTADGGLYPERIKNGSFEFDDPMIDWRRNAVVTGGAVGGFGVVSDRPLNANNTHFLRAYLEQAGEGLPLTNEGYRGIGVTRGAKFTFSVYARSDSDEAMSLGVELIGADDRPIAQVQRLSGFTEDWKKHSCTIESTARDSRAKLGILVKGTDTLDLDMVSLFPQETFNNGPNGLRPDLAQLLKNLKPGFVRFPGGCIVEGRTLSQRYQWKTTIGDLAQRKLVMNRWNVEFAAPRNAPDYYEWMGLGFFEYLQLCEDIGARPLPILNCGMACQFNLTELVPPIVLEGTTERIFVCASRDKQTGQIILKVVNAQSTARDVRINLVGAQGVQQTSGMQVLTAADLAAVNTLDEPTRVSPAISPVNDLGSKFQHQFPAYSLTVIRIAAARN